MNSCCHLTIGSTNLQELVEGILFETQAEVSAYALSIPKPSPSNVKESNDISKWETVDVHFKCVNTYERFYIQIEPCLLGEGVLRSEVKTDQDGYIQFTNLRIRTNDINSNKHYMEQRFEKVIIGQHIKKSMYFLK
jgi:hypothetical protein